MRSSYVKARGPIGAKLMIVCEAPTWKEVESDLLYSDVAGKELDRILRECGTRLDACWLTSLSKYYVPPRVDKRPFAVRCKESEVDPIACSEELQVEINEVQPNCILALGGSVLTAITGRSPIGLQRGSILFGMGRKVVGTYSPGDLIGFNKGAECNGYWNRQIIKLDIQRAIKQSAFPELALPSRSLNICRSSAQLADFYARNVHRSRLAVDIESLLCIPACVGLSFAPHEGLTVPLWNHLHGFPSIPDSDMVQMWMILSEMLQKFDIVGQNFKYDEDKLIRLGFSIRKLASDTMLKAFCINPELPKSLGFNTSIYTEEPFYKDEGMYEGSPEDLLIGCARDACVTIEIDGAMDADLDELGQRDYYEKFLMKLHALYLHIENQGFLIDEVAREALLRKYIEWDERINFHLFKLLGTTINTSSPKQVSILLFDNLGLSRRPGTSEEELTTLINSAKVSEQHKQIVELILEDRRVKKTISTYLMALPDFDGRMRSTYFICLETGRSKTGQQDPPIRPKVEVTALNGKKEKKVLGCAFQTITKHGDIGGDIRTMYVPDKDEIFIQADSSQAEARVIFLLSDDFDALEMIDKHDFHALTATWFIGGTEDDWSKKKLGYEHPNRFLGKTLRHAGHLGAGKKRAAIETNTQARKYKIPIMITEAQAGKALEIFHKKQPKIREIFHKGIISQLEKNRQLIAPLPYGIDAAVGGQRIFFERWGEDLFRQAFSYIPQRCVSENTKAAGLRILTRAPDARILVESHDALLFSLKKDRVDAVVPIIRQEFERPINFSVCSLVRPDLVIPCDIEIGVNYRDLNKFKFETIGG